MTSQRQIRSIERIKNERMKTPLTALQRIQRGYILVEQHVTDGAKFLKAGQSKRASRMHTRAWLDQLQAEDPQAYADVEYEIRARDALGELLVTAKLN